MVILNNGSIDKPMKVYDGYDARSEIENRLFREAKQAWFLCHRAPPRSYGFMNDNVLYHT
jgi:hypothetical protein